MSLLHEWELTPAETDRLTQLEAVIGNNIDAWQKVGAALLAVRDEQLYRRDFESFEDYVRDRWEMSRSRAYQCMDGVKILGSMSTTVDTAGLPKSERQVRELGKVPEERRAEVWERAKTLAPDGVVAAKHINQAAKPVSQRLTEKDARAVKGYPTKEHEKGAELLLFNTREPRGTIADFLNVHPSVVSNTLYQNLRVRTALAEKRENTYLEVGRSIGMTDEQVMAFLDSHSSTTVIQ